MLVYLSLFNYLYSNRSPRESVRPIPAERRDADDERGAPSSCKLREGGATGVMCAAYVTAYCPSQPVHMRDSRTSREREKPLRGDSYEGESERS